MSQATKQPLRLLVLVPPAESATETVEHAIRQARDSRAELDSQVGVDVRIVHSEPVAAGSEPGEMQAGVAGETPAGVSGENPAAVSDTAVAIEESIAARETGGIETELDTVQVPDAGPVERTESLLDKLDQQDVSRVVVDPEGDLAVPQLREAFGVTTVELAPSGSPPERRPLLHPGGWRRLATIFGLTYVFYLAIGGFAGGLDHLTGAISAGVVAVSLAHVALREEPRLGRTGRRLARTIAFLPVLLWEIAKANVAIAAVILHPRLPIDPAVETIETDAREGLERMVLANSITLTPGTLTIDVTEREFTIHSLTPQGRRDLAGGRLQRLVAWVFHGARADGGDDR